MTLIAIMRLVGPHGRLLSVPMLRSSPRGYPESCQGQRYLTLTNEQNFLFVS
jgi:hypothetical protein